MKAGAVEMAEWLKTGTALARDLKLMLKINIRKLNNSNSRRASSL